MATLPYNGADKAEAFAANVTNYVINPLLLALLAAALLLFVYGIIEFLVALNTGSHGSDDDKIKSGKLHMIFGLMGMFIMISAYSLIHILQGLFPIQAATNLF